jgi:SAM-dependent methyltransferase
MSVDEFLELFVKELELNESLRKYYRLINHRKRYLWRRAYLEQRLRYISDSAGSAPGNVWDVGCGYGTTAIFLALNGFNVLGNTLEFYFQQINNRFDYWSRYGNLGNLKVEYANLYDMNVPHNFYDIIVAQDTLHHLEPIHDAIKIFADSIKPNGKLLVTEENGLSFFIRMKNFSKRGFKKIVEYHDEQLNKTIPIGNENARGLKEWRRLFEENGFDLPEKFTEYIRLYPHFFYKLSNYDLIRHRELRLLKKLPMLYEFLFFGINFTAIQKTKQLYEPR